MSESAKPKKKNKSAIGTYAINESHILKTTQSNPNFQKKAKLLQIQTEVRRINRQLELEQQIRYNKKLFEELQLQLMEQEQLIKHKKKEKILNRLKELEKNKKSRKYAAKETDQLVLKIRNKEAEKKKIMEWIITENKKEYEQCYKKALKERKKLLEPIDFGKLNRHEKKYLKGKMREKFINEEEEQEEEQTVKNYSSEKNHQPKNFSERYKASEENSHNGFSPISSFAQQRHKQQFKLMQLKENLSKRYEYGNRVEKQYKHNRMKTESTRVEKQKIEAEQKNREILQRRKLLDKLKKPKLPFHYDLEESRRMEIQKIKRSTDLSPQQKLQRLNNLMGKQYEAFSLNKRKGKTENLDRISQINLVKASILLE